MLLFSVALNSNLAIEALAGLASKEDFTSVALKKTTVPSALLPFKDVMLLQVKGRRHVQTRLIEPSVTNINDGDNFILITPTSLYNYVGAYSNVIEQSRAVDICNHIQHTGDMGCKIDQIITINSNDQSTSGLKHKRSVWNILESTKNNNDDKNDHNDCTDLIIETVKAGHPSEDEIYESNILGTNMIYGLDNDELVPLDEYWGKMPKIEMLESTSVIVFDFGSEMYVWSGKNAPIDKKRKALKLAKELWEEGYNYTECNVCPLNVASILGERSNKDVSDNTVSLTGTKRPDWAIFAKITQHRETILFKEKFLDWPDFSRIIKIKRDDSDDKIADATYDNIKPLNIKDMLKTTKNKNNKLDEPDLIIEGSIHLGRGDKYFDEETNRLFEFTTLDLTQWRILENTSEQLNRKSIGHFYDSDSYILRWRFRMTVKGRELSGKPSKFAQSGRERTVYFCWQGTNSSINEKGYAALLTIELDSEKAPQIRVVQGAEPAAFLKLFNGQMTVHLGKRGDDSIDQSSPRLFVLRGEIANEVVLIEVPCNMQQLRSRTSFVLIESESLDTIKIWHGAKSSQQTRKVVRQVVDQIIADKKLDEFYSDYDLADDDYDDIDIEELEEGDETDEFLEMLGGDRSLYLSLLQEEKHLNYDYTMRVFYLSSISGTFESAELLCPYRSEYSSPYPFLQADLYLASQPGKSTFFTFGLLTVKYAVFVCELIY